MRPRNPERPPPDGEQDVWATDSDSGTQGMAGALFFANPNNINNITLDITLTKYSGIPCSTNSDGTTATFIDVGGPFFSTTGSGNTDDDVADNVFLIVDTNNPETIQVSNWLWGNGLGVSTPMGSFRIGTPLTVSLAWDKAHHKFISTVNVTGDGDSRTTVEVPYNVSDTSLPAYPWHDLSASLYSANCTSVRTSSAVEAFFDNVIVNAAPPSQNQQ